MATATGDLLVPFLLSFKLALWATPIVLVVCLLLTTLLTFRRFPGRQLIETLTLAPMILPPSVLGFYLLLFLAPDSFFGGLFDRLFGVRLVFSFPGLVVASSA